MPTRVAWKLGGKSSKRTSYNRQINFFQYFSCLTYESPLIHLTPFMSQQAPTREQINNYFLIRNIYSFTVFLWIKPKTHCWGRYRRGNLLWAEKEATWSTSPNTLHIRIFGFLVSSTSGLWNKLFRVPDHSFCSTSLIAATRQTLRSESLSI